MVGKDTIVNENSGVFLYLKKSFCIVECMRLGRVIAIDDQAVELTELENELQRDLQVLQEKFTYPLELFRTDKCIIDLELLDNKVKNILYPGMVETIENNTPEKLSNRITENDIYSGVDKKKAFHMFKQSFLESNSYWTDIGHSLVNLLDRVKTLFDALYVYLSFSRSGSSMTLVTAVHYLNLLEYLDWVFNLIQYDERIFNE